jgi:hypothetical protein
MKRNNWLFLIFWMFFTWGCVSGKPSYPDISYNAKLLTTKEQEALAKRFAHYWHARIHEDYGTSWEMELPYQRFLMDFKNYKSLAGGYKGAHVRLEKIEFIYPDEAVIDRVVIYPNNKQFVKKDKWYRVKGRWYHKFYQSVLPPKSVEEARYQ